MNDERGTSKVVYPEGGAGPDAAASGNVLLVAPFVERAAPRQREALAKELQERQVDSLQDLCRVFDVRIEGTYVGPDGEPVQVSIPVTDENTFTPDGMTHGDPSLFELYVKSRCYEQLAEYLQSNACEGLTDQEIAALETQVQALEAALEGDRS